jgi:hypothetical protein
VVAQREFQPWNLISARIPVSVMGLSGRTAKKERTGLPIASTRLRR